MALNFITAEEAANYVQNGDVCAFSGFTPAGAAKVVPAAIAKKAIQEHENGKEFKIGNNKHGLLLIMEVHRNEMEYAMKNGTGKLIEKLKGKGYYPYSDLDRESVINE